MSHIDPRDRGGPKQPLLTVGGLRKYFPLRNALGTVSAHVQAVENRAARSLCPIRLLRHFQASYQSWFQGHVD